MIEVKMTLYTLDEVVAHANFVAHIANTRAAAFQQPASNCGEQTGPATITEPTPAPALVTETTVNAPVEPAPDAGTPLDLSPLGVERTFREFITRKGTTEARKILDKYEATRLGDVKESQLPAFVAELVSA